MMGNKGRPMFEPVDRTKNNVIGTMRHAVACRLIQSDGHEHCDCKPVDDAKAMKGGDVQRVFAPMPPEELGFLKYIKH